ncbi:MAG: hypothetical protein KAJ15_14990, partial [Spirochaetes bacterium]|nr:hypothetical protein [Spirochaetota bacterium]
MLKTSMFLVIFTPDKRQRTRGRVYSLFISSLNGKIRNGKINRDASLQHLSGISSFIISDESIQNFK